MSIQHSSGPWKKHKYIKVVNGRYYYSESAGSKDGEVLEPVRSSTAKRENYIYNKRDEDKSIAGRLYSKAMRMLEGAAIIGQDSTGKLEFFVKEGEQAYKEHAFMLIDEDKRRVAGASR